MTATLIVSLLCGCGTTGKTTRFVLELDPATPASAATSLRVSTATIEPDAARLYTYGTSEMGRFNDEDLANIEQSLAATIATRRTVEPAAGGPGFDIHFRVRRYLVSHSNTGGGVLACVTWALVDPAGKIIFNEQFYAMGSGAYVVTIGSIKNLAHRSIVRRIAATALHLTTGPTSLGVRPVDLEGTTDNLEDAMAALPSRLVSRGIPSAMASPAPEVAIAGLLAVTMVGAPPWEAARPPADFDWAAYLLADSHSQ